MLNVFRTKSELEKLIAQDGMEHATDRFAEVIASMFASRQIAHQFILEELDGASMGNVASQLFAANSGIDRDAYSGTLNRSTPEVDGPEGPQQLLLALSLQLKTQELMAEFRCKVDDKIMQKLKIGKYAHTPPLPQQSLDDRGGQTENRRFFRKATRPNRPRLHDVVERTSQTGYVFLDINNDLGKSCEEIMNGSKGVQMAYAYARRAAVSALYLQGVAPRDAYGHVQAFFKSIQLETDQTVEFQKDAFTDAVHFMETYSHVITSMLLKKIKSLADDYEPEAGQVNDADFFKAVLDKAYSDEVAQREDS